MAELGIDLAGARPRRRRLEASQRRFAYAMLTPIMLYMMVFALLPMIWAVVLGFFDYSPARVGSGPLGLGGRNGFVGLENYQAMFGDSQPARVFRQSVGNTFHFALLYLPLNLLLTLPLAVMIESVSARAKSFFRAVYFLPTISSTVAVALIWSSLYAPQWGLISVWMRGLGMSPPRAFLSDPQAFVAGVPLALVAVLIAYLWQDFGYNLVLFIAALQGIPQVIKDAARVDGANAWQMFRHITLPLLRPTLLFVCVLTMLSSLQQFVIFQVMTNGGPRDQTTTILMSVYNNAFRYQNMGWAAAMSMVLFLIILLFTVLQFRLLRSDWEY
jgi:multiple sugar transport system permease protein/raffinose/stachyose/melibiose transport system permease protein